MAATPSVSFAALVLFILRTARILRGEASGVVAGDKILTGVFGPAVMLLIDLLLNVFEWIDARAPI